MNKNKSELRKIPFIGPNIEQDLLNIGISRIARFKRQRPGRTYRMDCELKDGRRIYASCMFSAWQCIMPTPKPGTPKAENGGIGRIKATQSAK